MQRSGRVGQRWYRTVVGLRSQVGLGLGFGSGVWSGFGLMLRFGSQWRVGLRLGFVSGLRFEVGKELVWLSREKGNPWNLQDWAQQQLGIAFSG